MKNIKNHCMCVRLMLSKWMLAQWWNPVASSEPLWTSSIGRCVIIPVHCHGQRNGQQSRCFFIIICCMGPWWPLGQYGVISCLMAASRGFGYSPGHAALGDVGGIAPTPLHGHQNGQQRRYICSPLSILSSIITIAEHHSNT